MADVRSITLPDGTYLACKDHTARTDAAQALSGLNGKLSIAQGAQNVGKCVVVGNDGNLVLGEAQASGGSAFTDVSFSIAVSDWTNESNTYTATVSVQSITANSVEWLIWGESYYTYAQAPVNMVTSTGTATFTTSTIPTGTISGMIRVVDIVPINIATQQVLNNYVPVSEKGANGGVATLDQNGNVPLSQLSNVNCIYDTDETQSNLDIADGNGYVLARFYNGHIQTKNFDSSVAKVGFEWKIYGSTIFIAYGYNIYVDAVVIFDRGRANNLFDFSSFSVKQKGTPLTSYTTVWSLGTDMHSPFQFNAVNNADGYNSSATIPGFVGGNHTLDQLGTGFETATSKYFYCFADGTPVTHGSGRAAKFEIRWANDVQAYNTVKQGGGGRACLTEYHSMIFDGVRFNETVKLVALEDIDMRLWYGFQFVDWGTTYTNLRFIDAANTGVYTSGDVNSGSTAAGGMEVYGATHQLIMTVDEWKDLGRRSFVSSGSPGAFTSGTKGYFRIIQTSSQNIWTANTAHYLHGSYRFMPVYL